MMESELAASFGLEKTQMIQEKLGSEIEQLFLGFGVCEQRFVIKEVYDGPHAMVKVFRSASVVPEALPHLPASLASFGGSTATAIYTLEMLKTGEYSVVAPAIEEFLARGGRIPSNG